MPGPGPVQPTSKPANAGPTSRRPGQSTGRRVGTRAAVFLGFGLLAGLSTLAAFWHWEPQSKSIRVTVSTPAHTGHEGAATVTRSIRRRHAIAAPSGCTATADSAGSAVPGISAVQSSRSTGEYLQYLRRCRNLPFCRSIRQSECSAMSRLYGLRKAVVIMNSHQTGSPHAACHEAG